MIKQSMKGEVGHHKDITLGSTLLRPGMAMLIMIQHVLPYASTIMVDDSRLEIVEETNRKTIYVGDVEDMRSVLNAAWLWAACVSDNPPIIRALNDELWFDLNARNGYKICDIKRQSSNKAQLDALALLALDLPWDVVMNVIVESNITANEILHTCTSAEDAMVMYDLKSKCGEQMMENQNLETMPVNFDVLMTTTESRIKDGDTYPGTDKTMSLKEMILYLVEVELSYGTQVVRNGKTEMTFTTKFMGCVDTTIVSGPEEAIDLIDDFVLAWKTVRADIDFEQLAQSEEMKRIFAQSIPVDFTMLGIDLLVGKRTKRNLIALTLGADAAYIKEHTGGMSDADFIAALEMFTKGDVSDIHEAFALAF